jgi:hypothetical protein
VGTFWWGLFEKSPHTPKTLIASRKSEIYSTLKMKKLVSSFWERNTKKSPHPKNLGCFAQK